MRTINTRWITATTIAIAVAVILNNWQPDNPIGFYNTTASAPKGFYQILPNTDCLQRGQYVVIPVPTTVASIIYGRGWGQPGKPLLKQIGALPGDVVTISDSGIYVNQEYIGPVYLQDRQGQPLPQIRGTLIIKQNEFLPISQYERSFDGRYFGPVSISTVIAKVEPLLIW